MADALEETKDDALNLDAMFDASVKKKKKKKKKDKEKRERADLEDAAADDEGATAAAAVAEAPSYDYVDLLERVYGLLKANNPELTERKRHTMKPPQVIRVGGTRTAWVNFMEICNQMKRQPEHVMAFFLAELGTDGSVDKDQRFLMRGKFVPMKIESLLKSYIKSYVKCQMCRSPLTTLTRDATTRIYFVNCSTCGAARSVATIRSGYHAVARGERRKARK